MRPLGVKPVFWALALLGAASGLFAATAADYAAAGLKLYNAKNYAQALQYFNAALQADPNNAQALMGAGNCYYAQGQTAPALEDYQKLQALQPHNSQLTAFIQTLETPAGYAAPQSPAANPAPAASSTASSAPSAAAAPASPEDQAGIALYNQKQFEAAIPYFRRGIERDPRDALAYQYLGLAQVQSGHLREGTVALDESNYLRPDPPTAAYAYQLRGRLSPPDQMWVDAQLAAAGMPAGGSAAATSAKVDKPFGGYLVPVFQFTRLTALETNASHWQMEAADARSTGDSVQFGASVP
ncbi:MAG TPA: tetratricopeptide repeat protein, partial [bacterium]|nr:tetratricopeptide repeat protein [bacterium]